MGILWRTKGYIVGLSVTLYRLNVARLTGINAVMPLDFQEFFNCDNVSKLEKEVSVELEHVLCGGI